MSFPFQGVGVGVREINCIPTGPLPKTWTIGLFPGGPQTDTPQGVNLGSGGFTTRITL